MKLAVGVMAKFLRVLITEESVGVVLEAVERVADTAFDPRLSQVLLAEGVDLLGEVPAQEINSAPFRERRWPQLMAAQSRLGKKNAALIKRRAQLRGKKRKMGLRILRAIKIGFSSTENAPPENGEILQSGALGHFPSYDPWNKKRRHK